MAKPTTRFVVPYLTLVGQLKEEASKLDPVFAFMQMKKHYAKQVAANSSPISRSGKSMSQVLDRKGTLVTRPIERFIEDPHLLSGWLSINRKNFRLEKGKVIWLQEPAGDSG